MLTENKTSSEKEQMVDFFTKLLKEVESSYSYTIPYAFLSIAVMQVRELFRFSPFVIDNRLLIICVASFLIFFLLQLNYFLSTRRKLSFIQLVLYIILITFFNTLINYAFNIVFTDFAIKSTDYEYLMELLQYYSVLNSVFGIPSYMAFMVLLKFKKKLA